MNARSRVARVLAWLLAVSLAAPQMLEARYTPSHSFNALSRAQEIQIGRETAADASRKLQLLGESDPIASYVQRLGQSLAENAPGQKTQERWPFSFHVVNQKAINAFALPGGPVYINLGCIQAADNEAQLAGVLAHEISHVVQRHATRAATRQMEAQVPLAILGSLLGGGIGGQLARLGVSFGVGSYFMKNSRQAESEADLMGADIMYDTGYDPHQLVVFFKKLEAQGASRMPQLLSDHPNPGNREQLVAREVATLTPRKFRDDSAEFRSIKREAMAMKPQTAQQTAERQRLAGGAAPSARGEMAPSESLRRFEHNAYLLSYPENWRVFGDPSSAVTIAPEGGVSENGVSYGVIISGFTPEQRGASALDDGTYQLIQTLRQSNPDLRVVGRGEDIKVNGVSGKSVDMIGFSPIKDASGRAERERNWLVTLQRSDGGLLYLVFIAPDRDFDPLRPAYENMLRSLKVK